MKLFICGRQRSQYLGRAPTIFVGPQRSQYSRSWHSSPASRAKRKGTVPSLTARKGAYKAFASLDGQLIDHVTMAALQNLGCQNPHIVFSCIMAVSSATMSERLGPDQTKRTIMFRCSTCPNPEKELDLIRTSSSKCKISRNTIRG